MLDQDHSFLRVFSDDLPLDPVQHNLISFPQLVQQFEALTGWSVAYRETTASRVRRQNHPGQVLPVFGKLVIEDMSPLLKAGERAVGRAKCEAFLSSLNQLFAELDESRDKIWRQDALLATGIPVSVRSDSTEKLAILLQSLLRSAADTVHCDSAALYMLDDGTNQLDLRCQITPDGTRSFEPSRELRTCKADLEALLGNAVVLEDTNNYQQWKIPSACGSAVCLPVSSANTLLGTFWVCSPYARPFNGAEINVLEIIAGRIATELERFALIQSMRMQAPVVSAPAAGPHLPNISPPIEELRISGEVRNAQGIVEPGAVYDWAICKQGRLAFLLGHAPEDSANPGIAVTILQTAFRAHSTHCRSAAELFDAIFETSITVSSGLDPVRFVCGYVEPGSGHLEYAGTECHVGTVKTDSEGGEASIQASTTPGGEFGIAHCGDLHVTGPALIQLQITRHAHTRTDAQLRVPFESPDESSDYAYVDDFHLPAMEKPRAPRPVVQLQVQLGCRNM